VVTYYALVQIFYWFVLALPRPAVPPHAQPQQQATRSPHGALAIPCENCHTSGGWRPIRPVPEFDHNKTKYQLRGMHEKVQCTRCHIKPVFTDAGKNCQDCHADIHRRKMGANCAQCHTVLGWQIGTQQIKDHQNRFPLFGAHAAVPCEQCHKGVAVAQYQGLSTACASCHLKDYQKAVNPNHASAGFSTTCNLCHSADTWLRVKFDHNATGFPLTNGHANVPCQQCHINNNYNLQIAPTDCGNSGCHLTKWRQTTTPVHSAAGPAFAVANCANCHTTKGWDSASFDHAGTGFALTGTHASPVPTPCSACHVSNNYSLNSSDCMGCHLAAWNSTPTFGGSVPDHVKANFPSSASACATCHPITKWADGKLDHNAFGFPLTNSHALVANGGKVPACTSCHINNNYGLNIAPTDCGNAGCHLTTWQQTTNPNHAAAGSAFAVVKCSTCHNTISWSTATFDHAATGFALIGTHASPVPTPCAACHVNNNYTLSSTDCMGCHLAAWNSTPTFGGNVPDHIKAGFPSNASACATCHPITKWADGKFDHAATGWPLTGFHLTSTTCAQCHINGNYSLTAANTDCYGCHAAAWQSTTTLGGNVPNHIAAGYPTTCASCHNTTSWLGATFNHPSFKIPHHGSVCSDCHLVSTNYATFSCINCHTNPFHTKAQTDPHHTQVGGYVYGPTTCYNCHK
jgi:hypothetical protein